MKRLLMAAFLTSCLCGQKLDKNYQERIAEKVKTKTGDARNKEILNLVKPSLNAESFAQFALDALKPSVFANLIKHIEQTRTDQQAGASAGSGGTTSIVSKGVIAKTLSVAAEYGGVTESVNQQTVTVKGSLDGIPAALVQNGIVYYCIDGVTSSNCVHKGAIEFLRRISYSASFDTTGSQTTAMPAATPTAKAATSSTTTPVTFDATRDRISAISGQFVLWNNRDVNSDSFRSAWTKALTDTTQNKTVSAAANKALSNFIPLIQTIESTPGYEAWETKASKDLAAVSDAKFEDQFSAELSDLVKMLKYANPQFGQVAAAYTASVSAYVMAQDQFTSGLADKPVVTLEYDDNRPAGQQSNSTFRLIYDQGIGKNWSLTGNFAVNIYDSPQTITGVGRLRDIQLGVEVDRKLPSLAVIGAATLSGAYYFQDQKTPILTVDSTQPLPGISFVDLPSGANQVFAQTGNIHIGQVRLTLGTGSSARIPIAVTWSNRSELVPKPDWRAQIGISYSLDALFNK